MKLNFTPVTLTERDNFYHIWHKTPKRSLDYTLPNLWGWQAYYGLEWAFDEELCWVRQTLPQTRFWAPIGDWNSVNWNRRLLDKLESPELAFIRVPEELVAIWQATLAPHMTVEEERGQWEYLYLQSELADLPGNRFHKKKNHLNTYIKTYGEPDYHVISPKMVEDVLSVQDTWCQWHECEDSPSLAAENEAVNRVLCHWDKFEKLTGGSLYVDGTMIAFSVGEELDPLNLGVHYEKGLNGYKGVYQAINCLFARNAGKGFEWINRAQDLDEEGLRQAKLTYQPAGFLKKCGVTFRK